MIEIDLECLPEDEYPDFSTDEDNQQVLLDLDTNEWAWCVAHVIARWD